MFCDRPFFRRGQFWPDCSAWVCRCLFQNPEQKPAILAEYPELQFSYLTLNLFKYSISGTWPVHRARFFVLDFRKIGGEFEPSLPTVFFLWSYSRVNVRIIVFLRVIYFQYTCQLYVTYFIYTSTLLLNHFIRRILGSPEVLRSVFSSGPKKKIRFGYGNPGNVLVQPPRRRWSYTIR